MTTVTLSALRGARDESLRVQRSPWAVRAWRRVRTVDWAPATARMARFLVVLAGFLHKHLIVVAAVGAFVVAAATVSTGLAWLVAGTGLLFLEVRRR